MHKGCLVDMRVAELLACVPAFRRWTNSPLDPKLRQILREADEQTLLSLTAYAMRRLTENPPDNQ